MRPDADRDPRDRLSRPEVYDRRLPRSSGGARLRRKKNDRPRAPARGARADEVDPQLKPRFEGGGQALRPSMISLRTGPGSRADRPPIDGPVSHPAEKRG